MKLEGERTLPGRPEKVWEMLLDPDVLVAAIPGCQQLDRTGEDRYEGKIEAKVGSIQSRYDTTFQISEKDPPRRYRLEVEGQGTAGFMTGDAVMRMAPAGGEKAGTVLRYDIDAQVGGRIAQIGQRMIRATASAMIDKGFADLEARIRQELQPGDASSVATQSAGDRFWKKLLDYLRTARVFLKTLLASPEGKRAFNGSPVQPPATANRKAKKPAPEASPSVMSAGNADTRGVPPPPPGVAGDGAAASKKAPASEEKKTPGRDGPKPPRKADTSGMPPPPSAS